MRTPLNGVLGMLQLAMSHSLPEVVMHRALLPAGGLAHEVTQQYTRALIQQAYMLVPSADRSCTVVEQGGTCGQ